MIKRKIIIAILIFLLSASASFSFAGSGGHSGAFLRIPVGARPAGMGNAFVSVADDANVLFYNPGGIYQLKGASFAGMYSLMSMDRSHYQGSFIWADRRFGSIGLMYSGYSVGKIDGRDSYGNPTGEFSNNEMAFSLTYGRSLLPFLGIGGSVKYLSHSLESSEAKGLGFDVGTHLGIDLKNSAVDLLSFGLSLSNLSSTLKWNTDSGLEEKIPLTMRYGASLHFNFNRIGLLLAGGGTETIDEPSKYNAGIETWIYDILGLRAGLNGEDLNFGASLRFNQYQFDYAFCPDVLDEGATSKLAIQIKFGDVVPSNSRLKSSSVQGTHKYYKITKIAEGYCLIKVSNSNAFKLGEIYEIVRGPASNYLPVGKGKVERIQGINVAFKIINGSIRVNDKIKY